MGSDMAWSKGNFKSCRIIVLIKESITAGPCFFACLQLATAASCLASLFFCVCAGRAGRSGGWYERERKNDRGREIVRGKEGVSIGRVLKPPTKNSH